AMGVTTPAFEGTFVAAESPPRTLVTDRVLAAHDLVHLCGGVLRAGWEGWLSRTATCAEPSVPQRDAFASSRRGTDAVLAVCVPGASVGALRGAGHDVTVDGVGMGHEELGDDDVLEPGMVLAVEVRSGDVLGSEVLLVTPSGHEELTGFSHPLS